MEGLTARVVTFYGKPMKDNYAQSHAHGSSDLPGIFENAFSDVGAKAELVALLKCRATSTEERYKILDARDKLLRLLIRDERCLKINVSMQGTCPDMCPEKERLFRDAKHQISVFELRAKDGFLLDHNRAVKQYVRSSANQESPLAHELRSESVLRLTMDYLINQIMDNLENLYGVHVGEWYHFLWDRTRSIRKDIIQQELCSVQTVVLIEECARFHIHCAARLIAEEPAVFDQKINTENLTKCLQTLKYMYNDLRLKNIQCLNEPEFRGYIVLLNLNDSNFLADIKILSQAVRSSQEIKFALEVAKTVANNNYVRFFELVRQTSYLNACILLRYFMQVRVSAVRTIMKSYHSPRFIAGIPVTYLYEVLAFENEKSCSRFFEGCGLLIISNKVMLDRKLFRNIQEIKTIERALNVVETKRQSTVGNVIYGKVVLRSKVNSHVAQSSFDSNGYLKDEAFDIHESLKYLKNKSLTTFTSKEINELPSGSLSTLESQETPDFPPITSDNAVICIRNASFFNSINYEPATPVQQDKSNEINWISNNASYDKLNLARGLATSGSGGSLGFQKQAKMRLQPLVNTIYNKLPTEKDRLKNVVEDIISNYIDSKLEEILRYELSKLEEIHQISFQELETLVNFSTSIDVATIAYDQLSIFKKNKTSNLAESPASWLSDNLFNKSLKFSLPMKSCEFIKNSDKNKMAFPKLFSVSSTSVSLRASNRLKILMSFPDRHEACKEFVYFLNCYGRITEGGGSYCLMKNFPNGNSMVCIQKIVGQQFLKEEDLENSESIGHFDSIIFVMTLTNMSMTEKRLYNVLQYFQFDSSVPLHLIIYDFSLTSRARRHKFQVDNLILKTRLLNSTVKFCHVNENLSDAFMECFKYISMKDRTYMDIEAQDIMSFLCNVLGSLFWHRVSEALLFPLRQYWNDPNLIVRLYNEAIKNVSHLLIVCPNDRREQSKTREVESDCSYVYKTKPEKRILFWRVTRNNDKVIGFLNRLKLNNTDFDFSSFENLKNSIENCCNFMNETKVNNILQHFPNNVGSNQKINEEFSWMKVVKTIALEIFDSSWAICNKDMPVEVFYHKSHYDSYMSNTWFLDQEFLSNFENACLRLDAENNSTKRQKAYEGENAPNELPVFKIISPGLKRKRKFANMCQPEKEKKDLKDCKDRILEEELELRRWELLRIANAGVTQQQSIGYTKL